MWFSTQPLDGDWLVYPMKTGPPLRQAFGPGGPARMSQKKHKPKEIVTKLGRWMSRFLSADPCRNRRGGYARCGRQGDHALDFALTTQWRRARGRHAWRQGSLVRGHPDTVPVVRLRCLGSAAGGVRALNLRPLLALAILALPAAADAQDIEPRAYSNAPVGVHGVACPSPPRFQSGTRSSIPRTRYSALRGCSTCGACRGSST